MVLVEVGRSRSGLEGGKEVTDGKEGRKEEGR